MKPIIYTNLALWILWSCSFKEDHGSLEPEPQISFALENKTHDYYVEQAELWWKQIEKDTTSEDSWFNYYRACRNAQGTADWREDFVKESPYLRLGDDIVILMEVNIPNTFTYFYVKGSTRAVDPTQGAYLLKAYEMNPDFPGIQAAVVTYAVSTHDPFLRAEVNKRWDRLDYLHPGLLQYSQNLLQSLETNAIVLTQHDNDSYPAWLLQDSRGLKQAITVLNIDFLLLETFREKVFEELGVPPFELDIVDVDDYRQNWKNVVQHFLANYKNKRPLYIGLTVSPDWYQGFESRMYLHGLAYKFVPEGKSVLTDNLRLYEEVWDLDNVNLIYENYYGQQHVNDINANYLEPLAEVYRQYVHSDDRIKSESVRQLATEIALKTGDKEIIANMETSFNAVTAIEPQ